MCELIAAARSGFQQQVEQLIESGTSVNFRDPDQATALYWTAVRGNPNICSALCKAKSDLNSRVTWGSTPLHAACDRGHTECVKILISSGADPDCQNNRGDTPLHIAAYRGYADIVLLLTKGEANPTLTNHQGKISKQEAEVKGHEKVMYILEEYIIEYSHMKIQKAPSDLLVNSKDQELRDPSLYYYSNTKTSGEFIPSFMNVGQQHANAAKNITDDWRNVVRKSTVHDEDSVPIPKFNSVCLRNQDVMASGNQTINSNNVLSMSHANSWNSPSKRKNSATEGLHFEATKVSNSQHVSLPSRKRSDMQIDTFTDTLQLRLIDREEKLESADKKNHDLQAENRHLKETIQDREQASQIYYEENCLLQKKMQDVERSRQGCELKCQSLGYELQSVKNELQHIIERKEHHSLRERSMTDCSGPSKSRTLKDFMAQNLSDLDTSHTGMVNFFRVFCADCLNHSFVALQNLVKGKWLQSSACKFLDVQRNPWVIGKDYVLMEDFPMNHIGEGNRDGACSLIFRIKHHEHKYILKMMINLINMDFNAHGQGHSLDSYLLQNFGSEHIIPIHIPNHRNIMQILHHFEGPTDHFKKFLPLLIPQAFDVPIDMANRTTYLVMKEYPLTLMSFMVEQKSKRPPPFYGMTETFILHLLYQLLSAVCFLLKNNVVHRDIKADNILLDNKLVPILGDFGFARKCHNAAGQPIPFTSKDQAMAGNPHAWAPEVARLNRTGPESLPKVANLIDIYRSADAYALSRMFYNLLRPIGEPCAFPQSSVNRPHYSDTEIPSLPQQYSPGLKYVLQQLVLDNPTARLKPDDALKCVGMLLFRPYGDELKDVKDVSPFCQARLHSLLTQEKCTRNISSPDHILSIEDSVRVNSFELEADFFTRISIKEFWDIYVLLERKGLISTS